ncbi:uncharacterized protein LOC131860020 [Cryptomeria japonica]|uniref:uncharacterized protein LOC131860020 n=1 Tax=Cryptomeria japonica TaxID=3369 RepID=UPI0027D9F364|nr:uncharacterized protein LOC131860020 [Cryptomeria japonica]
MNGEFEVIGGDFNATLENSKKKGGLQTITRLELDFQAFIDGNNQRDIPTKNGKLTWTNRRKDFTSIAQKHDYFFVFGNWNNELFMYEAEILPYIGSDHFLVLLRIKLEDPKGGSPFKFEDMWLRDPSLKELVHKWWMETRIGNQSKLYLFSKKLAHVKRRLKENKEQFKNIFVETDRISRELEALNKVIIENGMGVAEYELEKRLN